MDAGGDEKMTELEYAWENARSIRGNYLEMEYIGTVNRAGLDFLFYRDKKGEYWYRSERRKD